MGTAAVAGPVYETGSGGTFTYYGQFNPSVLSFDDGTTTTDDVADNAASGSRVGFLITQPFGGNELRFRFETALGFRGTDGISQTSTPKGVDWDRTRLRHVDVQFQTASYGTFYFGQGSMASDGIGDRSLAGTGLATSVSIGDTAGSFEFRTTSGALSGIEIGDAFANFDGSRRGRIRYDTPEFSGFTFSIAYGQDILSEGNDDDFYDIGLGYENEFANGIEMEAGLGYQVRERDGAQDREDTFASISFLLPSGVNATFAAGDRNTSGNYSYIKLGYTFDVLAVGSTAVSVDFYSGSDNVTNGDEAEAWGLAIVQDFDTANVEAYFGYRNYSYSDTTATSYEDADGMILGARWRF
jgi:hypothetical protein